MDHFLGPIFEVWLKIKSKHCTNSEGPSEKWSRLDHFSDISVDPESAGLQNQVKIMHKPWRGARKVVPHHSENYAHIDMPYLQISGLHTILVHFPCTFLDQVPWEKRTSPASTPPRTSTLVAV